MVVSMSADHLLECQQMRDFYDMDACICAALRAYLERTMSDTIKVRP
jgi:hypothetical protein